MINSEGKFIYTSAEVGHELGLNPKIINVIGERLYGHGKTKFWTPTEVQRIAEYTKSISVEGNAERLAALHRTVNDVMWGKRFDEAKVIERLKLQDWGG